MTLEDRLERLASRTPPGDPADVIAAARSRVEADRSRRRSGSPRLLAAAAAVLAAAALGAGALALTDNDAASVTVAGPDGPDVESRVVVPELGASAQHLADGTPVWVVRHDDGSVSVLDAVSTHRPFGAGTLVGWCESSRGFVDPMYGSRFDERGLTDAGPAPRSLGSYPVVVDGGTATVTGPPTAQPRAADGGPKPSDTAGVGCLDLTSVPVDGYLPGSYDLHPYDTEAPMTPEDAVRQPDGTFVLVDAPVVLVEGEEAVVCTSPPNGSPPACEGVPAPGLALPDGIATVLRGRFIARPVGGALRDIAYVGERTLAYDGAEGAGNRTGRGGVDGPVLYGPEEHSLMEQAIVDGRLLLRGGCLYLPGEGGEAEYPLLPVVWPNRTAWEDEPDGVRLADGTFVPVGATVTASGGFQDIGRLAELGHDQVVADRAQACDVGGAGVIAYVQGDMTVGGVDAAVDGDAAVWDVDAAGPPTPDSDAFTALVTRLGCSGGETGKVLEPVVVADGEQVVVTFSVEPLPNDAYPCPGNDSVPYVVELGEPLGDRELVDGACLSGEAESTSFCSDGALRWPPPA